MTTWAVRRVFEAVLLTLASTVVLVALVHLLPGDPLAAVAGERALDPGYEALLRSRWGLDRPWLTQVGVHLSHLLRGDLGTSIAFERPVARLLGERLGPTLALGGLTLLVNFTVGLAIGTWTALRPGTVGSRVVRSVTLIGYTLPSFVIGLVLVWLVAVQARWLPAGGLADPLLPLDAAPGTVLLDRLRHLILPLATMVLATIAVPIRHQASAVAATREAAWVTAARARGIAPWRVTWRYVWRPALVPIATLLGLWLPMLVSGAVFVEAVFAWPGVGALIAEATAQRDLPLVIGAGVLLIAAVQAGSCLADVLYRVVDPRQRGER